MRLPRITAEGSGFYHCLSRVIDRRFILQNLEKEHFQPGALNAIGEGGRGSVFGIDDRSGDLPPIRAHFLVSADHLRNPIRPALVDLVVPIDINGGADLLTQLIVLI